jgi:SPW repeat
MWKIVSGRQRPEAVLDLYNLVLGALLFLSPWLFAFAHGTAGADAWLGGATIAALSLAALMLYAEWEEWITLAAGLWMILSPFVLGFTHTTAMHVVIGIGFVVTFLAALDLWSARTGSRIEVSRQGCHHIFASGSKNSIMLPSGSAM